MSPSPSSREMSAPQPDPAVPILAPLPLPLPLPLPAPRKPFSSRAIDGSGHMIIVTLTNLVAVFIVIVVVLLVLVPVAQPNRCGGACDGQCDSASVGASALTQCGSYSCVYLDSLTGPRFCSHHHPNSIGQRQDLDVHDSSHQRPANGNSCRTASWQSIVTSPRPSPANLRDRLRAERRAPSAHQAPPAVAAAGPTIRTGVGLAVAAMEVHNADDGTRDMCRCWPAPNAGGRGLR